jgi:hypothetical protein
MKKNKRLLFYYIPLLMVVEMSTYILLRSSATDRAGHLAALMGRVALVTTLVFGIIHHAVDRRQRGMSKDQYLLARVGGPDALLQNARKAQVLGVALLVINVGFPWVIALHETLRTKMALTCILGIALLPAGLGLLWVARKQRHTAQNARLS